ncbi:Uncharacterised protein [Klebsiella pneumoniae subsp. rhinoscleromatis]|nr:Uncharacterised protein [Klebsiella pneumoniae subsp. rhinoscleromatis]
MTLFERLLHRRLAMSSTLMAAQRRRHLNHLHQAQVLPLWAISLHNRMVKTLPLMVKASKKRLRARTESSKKPRKSRSRKARRRNMSSRQVKASSWTLKR